MFKINRQKMKAVLLLAGMAFILSACSGAKENEGAKRTFFAMDTYITLNAYGKNADAALDMAEDRIMELEHLWSVTDEKSETGKRLLYETVNGKQTI